MKIRVHAIVAWDPLALCILNNEKFNFLRIIFIISLSHSLCTHARRHYIRLGSGSASSDAGGEAFECNRRLLVDWL